MGDNAKELKVQITTVADTAGAVATEKALQGVEKAADKVAPSSKQASAQIGEIAPNAQKAAQAVGDLASKGEAVFISNNNAAKAAANLGGSMANAAGQIRGTTEIIKGLSQAGDGGRQSLDGLGKIAQGVFGVFRSASPFGLIVAGLVAATAAFALYKDRLIEALNNTKENDKATKDLTDRAAALKVVYSELEKAATASFEKQAEGIKKVTDSLTEFITQADAARKRIDGLNDAQTELRLSRNDQAKTVALQGATTDEQKAAINRTFDRQAADIRKQSDSNKLTASDANAKIDIDQGTQKQFELSQERTAANLNVVNKRSALSDAQGRLQAADEGGTPVDSKLGRELRDQARAAQEDLKLAEESAAKLAEKFKDGFDKAQAKIDEGKNTLELNQKRRSILDTKEGTRTIAEKGEDGAVAAARKKQIDDLGKQAEDAAAKGDFEGQNTAVDARNKLLRQSAAEKAPQDLSAFAPRKPQGAASQDVIQQGGGALPGDKPKPLDTKPIEQGAKQEADDFSAVQEKSQAAINASGEEISKIKPPEPLDLDPISTGFTGYHEINMEAHKESQKRIAEAEKDIDRLRQQLSELARSSRN